MNDDPPPDKPKIPPLAIVLFLAFDAIIAAVVLWWFVFRTP